MNRRTKNFTLQMCGRAKLRALSHTETQSRSQSRSSIVFNVIYDWRDQRVLHNNPNFTVNRRYLNGYSHLHTDTHSHLFVMRMILTVNCVPGCVKILCGRMRIYFPEWRFHPLSVHIDFFNRHYGFRCKCTEPIDSLFLLCVWLKRTHSLYQGL